MTKFLASPVLTLVLLAALVVFLCLGTTGMFKNALETGGFSSMIFYSPLFLAVVLLFEFNLICCTARQFKKSADGRRKGSVLFHTGLIIIVLGALIQLAFGFTGYVRVREGAVVENRPDRYYISRKGVWHRQETGESAMFLQQTDIPGDRAQQESRGLLALVRDGEVVAKQWVGRGKSLRYEQMDIALNRTGYYLMLDCSDSLGKTYVYPLLLQSTETPGGSAYSGSLKIPGTGYVISVRSRELKEFEIKVDQTGPGEQAGGGYSDQAGTGYSGQAGSGYSGRAAVGDTITLDRHKITLSHPVPWMIFRIRYEYGFYVIYAGMIIAAAGMFILYGRRDM